MLVIRFLRIGKKNQPVFRIVVTDKKNPPRGGRFVEIVGFYNPLTKEKNLKQDRIKYWLSVGAKPSDTIHNLLISEKIIEGKKIPVHAKKPSLAPAIAGEEKVEPEKIAKEAIMEKSEAESPKKPSVAPASAEASAGKKAMEGKEPEEKPKKEKPKVKEKPKAASSEEEASLAPEGREEKKEEPKEEVPEEEKKEEKGE